MALTKVSTGVVDMSGNTGGLVISQGITAQQTTCNAAKLGAIRENTTTNKVEVCTNNSGTPAWKTLKEAPAPLALTVDYLLVAGGGGGGGSRWNSGGASGGGGGAGEYLYTQAVSLSAGIAYSVTVGDGGVASQSVSPYAAGQGGDSVFDTITVNGGGRGGSGNGIPYGTETQGGIGGSGGGGAAAPSSYTPEAGGISSKTGGGQGTAGGAFTSRNTRWGSGGGGGALTSGSDGTSSTGGNGGNGRSNTITGTNTTYAGGGGGGTFNGGSTYAGPGGTGGGGSATAINGGNATNNTGGGAGGGSYGSSTYGEGGIGGSGVVILKYPDVYQITFTAGANPAFQSGNSAVGTDTVTTIIAGSGTITFSLI
jgi:hypothetical protein